MRRDAEEEGSRDSGFDYHYYSITPLPGVETTWQWFSLCRFFSLSLSLSHLGISYPYLIPVPHLGISHFGASHLGIFHRYLSSVSHIGISSRCLTSVSNFDISYQYLISVSRLGISHLSISHLGISHRYLSSVSHIGMSSR